MTTSGRYWQNRVPCNRHVKILLKDVYNATHEKLLQMVQIYELDVDPWGEDLDEGKTKVFDIISQWTLQQSADARMKYARHLDKIVAEKDRADARLHRSTLAQLRKGATLAQLANSTPPLPAASLPAAVFVNDALPAAPKPVAATMQLSDASREKIRQTLLQRTSTTNPVTDTAAAPRFAVQKKTAVPMKKAIGPPQATAVASETCTAAQKAAEIIRLTQVAAAASATLAEAMAKITALQSRDS